MKIVSVVVGLSLLMLAAGCFEQAGGARTYKGPLFRYHNIGRTQLTTATNAARYKEIDAMPATTEMRGALAQKLAEAALPFWRKELPAGAVDQSTLLRPLMDDVLAAEVFLETRGAAGSTDTALAIQLADDRAQLWDRNLKQLMSAWKLGSPRDVALEGFKGWEVKKAQAPNTFQYFRAGKWVVIGLGQERLTQVPALLAEAKRSGRPVAALSGKFVDLAADLPALRAWFPALAQWPLPPVLATISGRGENVRTEVKFQFSNKIPWRYEPWKIATNLVGEPLTSFTLGQGIAPWLNQVKGLSEAGLNPLPNQFCAWGVNNDQCRFYFTVPVQNATNAMRNVSVGMPKFLLSRFTNAIGQFLYSTNRGELVWSGIPYQVPLLYPEKSGRDEFLFAGNFPLPPKHTPAPDELFAQVRGRTNLLYYDWEITEHRLHHGNQFYQIASLVDWRRIPSTNTVSQRWLSAISSKLGNSTTEITQTGPQELVLVRRSHFGFTGFELATFSRWFESPGFPLDFQMPPHMSRSGTNNLPISPSNAVPKAAGSATPKR